MLDNREISVAVWLVIFSLWGLSRAEVRRAGVGVVKAALAWKIVLCVSMMTAYVALVVLALRRVGLWNMGNLKDTVLWGLTSALVMVFDVGSVPEDERYLQKAIRAGLKISVILEFIVNLYVLNLFLELLLIPTATTLACLLVVAESKDEFKPVRSMLNAILTTLGLGLLAYATYRVCTGFQSFARIQTLTEFLLPIMLTMLFVPFLYLLATVVSYENLFTRLQFLMKDPELRRFTKLQLLRRFGLDFRALNRWAKRLAYDRPHTREQVLASIRSAAAPG